MPTGELAALGSALTFSFSSVIDKFLTRRLRPLSLAALASLGGSLSALIIMFALGKIQDIPDSPLDSLLLSIAGGIISLGIGFPLYLVFLRSVDINKAAPLSTGIASLLSVLSGVFILGETLSTLTIIGIVTIISGLYMLSISQRKQSEASQARWLGVKGMFFLVVAVSFWVAGFSLQSVALRELDPVIANGVRLPAVFAVHTLLALLGFDKKLMIPSRESSSGVAVEASHVPSQTEMSSSSSRHGSGSSWLHLDRIGRPSRQRLARSPGQRGRQRVALQIRPPVDWKQIRELEGELAQVQVALQRGVRTRDEGEVRLYMDLPPGLSPEATLTAMPAVAFVRRAGHWPGSQRIELGLRDAATTSTATTEQAGGSGMGSAPPVREVSSKRFGFLSLLAPVLNGSVGLGLGSLLMLIALERTGLAIAFVLSSTQLLWIAMLAAIFLRERLTRKTMFGIVTTAVGVALVVL